MPKGDNKEEVREMNSSISRDNYKEVRKRN